MISASGERDRADAAPDSAITPTGAQAGRHRARTGVKVPRLGRSGGNHRAPPQQGTDPREVVPPGDSGPFWRYITVVSVVGIAVLIAVLVVGFRSTLNFDRPYWVIVALLLLAEVRPLVKSDKRDPAGLTTSEAFVFALILHWGLTQALVALLGAIVLADAARRRRPWRTAFNVAQYTLAYLAAAAVLYGTSVGVDDHAGRSIGAHDLPAIGLAAIAFFVVNDVFVGVAVSKHERISWKAVLLDRPGYRVISTAAMLCVSPLLVVVAERSSGFLPLLLVPLYAVGQAAAIAQERERQALHDPLTGLANRTQLLERAGPAVSSAAAGAGPVALLMVDLDDFKTVNDTHGHRAGDELLRLVGARLAAAVRPGDVVARFGGDEFAVLLADLTSDSAGAAGSASGAAAPPERSASRIPPAAASGASAAPDEVAEQVAARIRLALGEPYQIAGVTVSVGASVGTAVAPATGGDIDALLHAADVAMYAVKAGHRRHGPSDITLTGPRAASSVIVLDRAAPPAGRR